MDRGLVLLGIRGDLDVVRLIWLGEPNRENAVETWRVETAYTCRAESLLTCTTNTTPYRSDFHPSRPYLGLWDVLNAEVALAVEHCCFHSCLGYYGEIIRDERL